MNQLDKLIFKMSQYYRGDAKRIQHFVKVHSLARLIGTNEGLAEHELFILEAAAITHDIGIKKAEELYHCCDGALQEQLGPDLARKMLSELEFDEEEISRVCYLIAHHHTYNDIDGKDYRILVEADFLVNLYENGSDDDAIRSAYGKIFQTETGKELCRVMFNLT